LGETNKRKKLIMTTGVVAIVAVIVIAVIMITNNNSLGGNDTNKQTGNETESISQNANKENQEEETKELKPLVKDYKTDFGVVAPSGTLSVIKNRVSVHDPSIEYDPKTDTWYIFGTHKAFAQTKDLLTWTYANGNGSAVYHTIFKECAAWSAKGGPQTNPTYEIGGNLWAPDVIWNPNMEKWCMYMSINGDKYYSSIAMATADNITGPYVYQGTVVYSGFGNSKEAEMTDYAKVTGSNKVDSRYVSGGKWNPAYGTNAIDPCVLYDKDGQLWMIYGSWFGGTYMLKLDERTGLRDYTYEYELDRDVSDGSASDPYLGIRISGGFGGTGEGPYIVWDEKAGFYYLYLSYCGLESTTTFSGYHMRMFRSENITGPYTDALGNYATRKNSQDNQNDNGIKIMGNYAFSSLLNAPASTKSQNGYKSAGHNSAIVDNEGNRYLVYHTRFNVNAEFHEVRVHQQFLNEDGWLVTAPYEYAGSKISESGYSSEEIVGSYELINHGNTVPTGIIAGMLDTKNVTLNADGTISGDYVGTWIQKEGSYYATMVIDEITYKGVFFKQFDESAEHKETMTFTLIGSDNIAIWGSKME